jgi:hypothetical protein
VTPSTDGVASAISTIEDPRFVAHASAHGTEILVKMSGSADMDVKTRLGQFLGAIHTHAVTNDIKDVHVDFQEVAFINSSCLKDFFNWILKVQETTADAQYRIHFHSNEARAWQHRSLHTLSSLAQDLVVVGY